MSLVQFLRILMARRWIILGALLVCLVTTGIVSLFVPKYYEGKSRVELNVVKPDPVTGEAISPNFMRAYTRTQSELIKDERTRSKEHTSELQSLMRISYAVFCLKKKKTNT